MSQSIKNLPRMKGGGRAARPTESKSIRVARAARPRLQSDI
jgi:hypothetical protein